ncbi:MAG: hypothetical protein ACERKO_01460 [Acetanaerobacterium sp.]
MKQAVIDLGSNTVRMSVFDVNGRQYQQILSEKELIGLIGYIEKGVLSQDGMIRVTDAIQNFKSTAEAIGISAVHCFATAGVRAIKNAEELLEKVERDTGVRIQIISGEEEARLDFMGALRPNGVSEGLVIDMGGGSTEIVRFKGMDTENIISMPFGSLSLYRRFVGKILPKKEEREEILEFVQRQLEPIEWLPESGEHVILIGGTGRAIARLHRGQNAREEENLHGYTFDAEDFDRLLYYIRHNKKSAIRSIFRVVPERIHTIVPGLITLSALCKTAGVTSVSISRTGVREGYLTEYVAKDEQTGSQTV